jgi:hypothetical protein
MTRILELEHCTPKRLQEQRERTRCLLKSGATNIESATEESQARAAKQLHYQSVKLVVIAEGSVGKLRAMADDLTINAYHDMCAI